MTPVATLILRRSEIARLLSLDGCIAAVEEAFRLRGAGTMAPPGILGMHVGGGGFHIKAAAMDGTRAYFAAKLNGNFPGNRERCGLPTIQGVIVLCDAENGSLLAVMDSMEITILRTGAATAVAARYLARADSRTATICGCGNQGRVQLRAIAGVLPIKRAYAIDRDANTAANFARDMAADLGFGVEAVADAGAAVSASDVCVTCTPSKQFFVRRDMVSPGTFVAGVGADNPEKQELQPELMVGSKVVVDSLEQCATIGDLHHALEKRVMTRSDVHAELAEVVSGKKPGRTSDDEITIFDSTGVALEDVAAAAVVYERAVREGGGSAIEFAA
jgi:alanine dehydrogenase